MYTNAVDFVLQPGEQQPPAPAHLRVGVHGAHGHGRAAHDAHHQLHARVRALLVVAARAGRRLQ